MYTVIINVKRNSNVKVSFLKHNNLMYLAVRFIFSYYLKPFSLQKQIRSTKSKEKK